MEGIFGVLWNISPILSYGQRILAQPLRFALKNALNKAAQS